MATLRADLSAGNVQGKGTVDAVEFTIERERNADGSDKR